MKKSGIVGLLLFGAILCGGSAMAAPTVLAPVLPAGSMIKDCHGIPPAPKSPSARAHADQFMRQGDTLSDLRQYDQALLAYSKALEIDPDYSEAYYDRALVHDAMGNYGLANKDYEKALSLNPQDACAHNNMGLNEMTIGNDASAMSHFDQAIALDPSLAAAYANRADLRSDLGQRELAIADYDQALKLEPDNADFKRGRAYVVQGPPNVT